MREFVSIMMTTYREWRDARTVRLGAGLAYYGVFAIVPALTVAVAVAQVIFRRADIQEYLAERLEALLGPTGRELAAAVTEQLDSRSTETGLGVLGIASLLFATTLVVLALQDAFNTIWGVPVTPGIRVTMYRRLRSLIVVLSAGALLGAALLLQTVGALLQVLLPGELRSLPALSELFDLAGAWTVLAVGFTLLFRFMIPVATSWRLVATVGALTATVATAGTWALGLYLSRVGGNSLTGAAGSVLLVLVWIFYQAQIVLAGCQLARVLHGRSRPPEMT
jgi:membrane protein